MRTNYNIPNPAPDEYSTNLAYVKEKFPNWTRDQQTKYANTITEYHAALRQLGTEP